MNQFAAMMMMDTQQAQQRFGSIAAAQLNEGNLLSSAQWEVLVLVVWPAACLDCVRSLLHKKHNRFRVQTSQTQCVEKYTLAVLVIV